MIQISNGFRGKRQYFAAVLDILNFKVNKQDFFQVFQGSGIGKMEDNLTSANPFFLYNNGSLVDLGSLVSVCL